MGCRIGSDSGPGRNRRHPDEAVLDERDDLPVHEATERIPLARGGHQLPVDDSSSATCPADDVFRTTFGRGLMTETDVSAINQTQGALTLALWRNGSITKMN